jgi:hypothetical protein
MKILFIGDIVGKPDARSSGRDCALVDHSRWISSSPTPRTPPPALGDQDIGDTLLEAGVAGDDLRQPHLGEEGSHRVHGHGATAAAPANYPAGVPGRGSYVAQTSDGRAVGVINVMGRVFMQSIDDPFTIVLKEIEAMRGRTRVIIVDFHAEATSEKGRHGMAPRRQGHAGRRHAHARADRRRADPAERHAYIT